MNSEQLQEWLIEMNGLKPDEMRNLEAISHNSARFLRENSPTTDILIDYMARNYADQSLSEPIFAQILVAYYRGGVLRRFALQLLPTLICTYLIAVSKRQRRSLSMLETLFMAIYNEEIMIDNNGDNLTKRQEIIRVPSIRYPSIYHDPSKMGALLPDQTLLTRLNAISLTSELPVQMTMRIGPFPNVDRLTSESRFMVLTRLCKSVNANLADLPPATVCRALCRGAIALSRSGFHFPESDLIVKVLGVEASGSDTPRDIFAIMDDFSSKPRIRLHSSFLLELLNGVYYSLYNGAAELALRAIDTAHQRASFELWPDVLLVTNAIINSVLEHPSGMPREEEAMALRTRFKGDHIIAEQPTRSQTIEAEQKRRRAAITNASLRIRRMPEDIPIVKTPAVESKKDEVLKKIATLLPDNLTKSPRDASSSSTKSSSSPTIVDGKKHHHKQQPPSHHHHHNRKDKSAIRQDTLPEETVEMGVLPSSRVNDIDNDCSIVNCDDHRQQQSNNASNGVVGHNNNCDREDGTSGENAKSTNSWKQLRHVDSSNENLALTTVTDRSDTNTSGS